MKVFFNGQVIEMEGPVKLTDILTHHPQDDSGMAVEINGKIIPRSRWNETMVTENEKISLIKLVGGG